MNLLHKLAAHAADIALVCGGVLVAVGCWMIYPPAGLLSAGGLLILGGWVAAKDPDGGDGV